MKYRPEYDPKIIGENLKRLRKEKSLSVEEVKEYLRLGSVQAIYKYENGKGYPQADTMFALMELYEASLSDITRKHYSTVYDYNGEGALPSSVICDYFIGDKEIIMEQNQRTSEFEQRRLKRLKKYYDLYVEYMSKGVAS